jgi:phosphate transport system permease protein
MSKKLKGNGCLESIMRAVFALSAVISILAVALICIFLAANAFPALREIGLLKFLFGTSWKPSDVPPAYGVLPMILGSLYVTAGAVIIGVPIGVLTAVFLAKSCPKTFYKIIKPGVDLLAGIPSVVYGFFGMAVLLPVFGGSIISASVLLGIMILPTVIGLSESALRAVPESYYEGALALGAGHYLATFKAVLPAAKSGIFAAIILGIGRAIGETMAVIMVAGNWARIPKSLSDGVRTLTSNIVLEMGYAEGLHRQALIATGLVLFVFILIINLSFQALKNRSNM